MINITKKVSERLEHAHDTLAYTHAALQDIKQKEQEIKEMVADMDIMDRLNFEARMAERLKILNQSVRVALAYSYHIN